MGVPLRHQDPQPQIPERGATARRRSRLSRCSRPASRSTLAWVAALEAAAAYHRTAAVAYSSIWMDRSVEGSLMSARVPFGRAHQSEWERARLVGGRLVT